MEQKQDWTASAEIDKIGSLSNVTLLSRYTKQETTKFKENIRKARSIILEEAKTSF